MCGECGYVESYVSESQKLVEISRKWDKLEPDDMKKKSDKQ